MLLKDKVIIVSGVGPGMGQALAKIAVAEGAKVGLGARNQKFLDKSLRKFARQAVRRSRFPPMSPMPISAVRWRRRPRMLSGRSPA